MTGFRLSYVNLDSGTKALWGFTFQGTVYSDDHPRSASHLNINIDDNNNHAHLHQATIIQTPATTHSTPCLPYTHPPAFESPSQTKILAMASHHKRHSILPPIAQAGPKPPVRFSSSLTIAESAVLSGSHIIQIRSESVVHPRAKIESLAGPIDIGRRCIVHERTHIGAPGERGKYTGAEGANAVTILDYCTVEVAATVEAGGTVIGEGTVVGVGSRVGSGAVIGKVRSLCTECSCGFSDQALL